MSKLTAFRLGSDAALASLSLMILGVAGVQGGPRWEIPVAAFEFFLVACMGAALLCVLAMWSFAQLQSTRSRWILAIRRKCCRNSCRYRRSSRTVADHAPSSVRDCAESGHPGLAPLYHCLAGHTVCEIARQLLITGSVYTQNPRTRHFACYRDVTPTTA